MSPDRQVRPRSAAGRHANIAITIDLYGHLMPGSEAEAADLLDAYLAREAGGTSPGTSPEPAQTAA